MRPQYAAQVDRSVVKSFQTPLRRQYALATMSSFAHFIHTNTAPVFSRSLVYVSGRSGGRRKKKSARPAEWVTSAGKWRSPRRESEQGRVRFSKPPNAKGFWRDKPIRLFCARRGFQRLKNPQREPVLHRGMTATDKRSGKPCSRVYYWGLLQHFRQQDFKSMNFKCQHHTEKKKNPQPSTVSSILFLRPLKMFIRACLITLSFFISIILSYLSNKIYLSL